MSEAEYKLTLVLIYMTLFVCVYALARVVFTREWSWIVIVAWSGGLALLIFLRLP